MSATLRVLFLAAEAEPFVKVGGLGDVAGALPRALRALPRPVSGDIQVDVRLVLPFHASIRANSATLHPVADFLIYRRGGSVRAQVYSIERHGLPVYFIAGDVISTAPTIYAADPALDREKYTFFSLAAVEMTRYLEWRPHILHANDWHTALALYAVRSRRTTASFARLKTALTLHNLPYMGGDGSDVLNAYGLTPLQDDRLPDWARTYPLPLGLWAADAIIPVSPSYAREILTPAFGCGLETFLQSRADVITGILNGLDYHLWNPESDPALARNYTAHSLDLRLENKLALQQQLDLPADLRLPLFGMVTRLDPQKGIDLAIEALRQLPEKSWQAVFLGTGDPALEGALRALQEEFPNRVRAVLRYDAALSRRIYAGADMLLMPSRYEPCGLAQMIAMRYGCVPIVHAVGGLKDTVQEGKNGFLFTEATAEALVEALQRALSVYAHPTRWRRFQRDGMAQEFSWEKSAAQYLNLYQSLASDRLSGERGQ
jgi:starch synthase